MKRKLVIRAMFDAYTETYPAWFVGVREAGVVGLVAVRPTWRAAIDCANSLLKGAA